MGGYHSNSDEIRQGKTKVSVDLGVEFQCVFQRQKHTFHNWGCLTPKIVEFPPQWFLELFLIKTVVVMAPHSSTLTWRIPWTEEPGRLQSMGSLRVRHD